MSENNLAFCGLCCSNCGKFKSGKCPGCLKNDKADWCGIRGCCLKNGYSSCAACTKGGPEKCRDFNNFFAGFFEKVFGSDRKSSIAYIKANGEDAYSQIMKGKKEMSFTKPAVLGPLRLLGLLCAIVGLILLTVNIFSSAPGAMLLPIALFFIVLGLWLSIFAGRPKKNAR